MTTEDDFQAKLDANPEDHHTRLVFADWLQERDDPRAEGYRAMGVLRRCPQDSGNNRLPDWFWHYSAQLANPNGLPPEWFGALPRASNDRDDPTTWPGSDNECPTRRAAEDAAAIAFAKLPAERRAELLAAQPEGAAP